MKIYLAGPMRGVPNFNCEAFHAGAKALREQGHEVFSPVEASEKRYGAQLYQNQPEGDEARAGVDGRVVFGEDLAWICAHAEAVALLPGWENSKGANAERATALALGLKIIELPGGRFR